MKAERSAQKKARRFGRRRRSPGSPPSLQRERSAGSRGCRRQSGESHGVCVCVPCFWNLALTFYLVVSLKQPPIFDIPHTSVFISIIRWIGFLGFKRQGLDCDQFREGSWHSIEARDFWLMRLPGRSQIQSLILMPGGRGFSCCGGVPLAVVDGFLLGSCCEPCGKLTDRGKTSSLC